MKRNILLAIAGLLLLAGAGNSLAAAEAIRTADSSRAIRLQSATAQHGPKGGFTATEPTRRG